MKKRGAKSMIPSSHSSSRDGLLAAAEVPLFGGLHLMGLSFRGKVFVDDAVAPADGGSCRRFAT